jgi:hypothetical protein
LKVLSLVIVGAIILGFTTFVATLLIWIFRTRDGGVESIAYEPSVKMRLRRAA